MQPCQNENKIRKMEIDLAVAQSDISKVKEDIKGIREKLTGFTWWFIGILSSIIGGMALLLYQIK